ncbi:hypothetical protein L210DRAFT_3755795 [Boletus edulis BED1]|uniref:F-box domain-containing protein n=1 Tax=Boletus edulis BED1 TaxID=1328754 RepID=A0AAD4C9H0_BOLED|nr:hypothetical protein L210DRAFT_3755795 [Boletus edulis BED1]
MHHALEIQEIVFYIFGHCDQPSAGSAADLAALARTCRTFKDPALDVLWEKLPDLSPLARCLPEASCLSFSGEIEWDILRSYARRVRRLDALDGISRKSLKRLWKPLTTEPLFPNLRRLYFDYTHRATLLLLTPFPSLISLRVKVNKAPPLFEDSIKSFARTSPNLNILIIHGPGINMNHIDPTFICKWQNLHIVICPQISLDLITLVHLSCMPALTSLSFMLYRTMPDEVSTSSLIFSKLRHLSLNSELLDPISHLLSRIQLPVVAHFVASIRSCPSRQDLSSFLAGVQTSDPSYVPEARPTFGFRDLRPYMTFTNLRHINFNVACKVDLTDSELLTLASAWPRLEVLDINRGWGWNTQGGITPNGLLQLLQTCPSLRWIALVIDTRGYTTIPPSLPSLGLSMPRTLCIHALDSYIEAESVPAISAFLAGLIMPSSHFSLCAWERQGMAWLPNRVVCKVLWKDGCPHAIYSTRRYDKVV